MSGEEAFFSSLKPAVKLLQRQVQTGGKIRIVTHNDADGLASGGILSVVAHRMGAAFRTSSEKKLDEKLVKSLVEENPDLILFSDFGSGYTDLIAENLCMDV